MAILKRLVNITYDYQESEPSHKENLQDQMASRIKKAWKRFRTHKIINQYASILLDEDNDFYDNEGLTDDHFSIDSMEIENVPRSAQGAHQRDPRGEEKQKVPPEIRNLKEALHFIRDESNTNSASTILHKLINLLELQTNEQGEPKATEILNTRNLNHYLNLNEIELMESE